MEPQTRECRDYGFVMGLLAGTFVGAGLAMWFAPRLTAELGERVSDECQQASARVGAAVADLTRKGQGVRDDVADAVVRGAREVERYATAVKTS